MRLRRTLTLAALLTAALMAAPSAVAATESPTPTPSSSDTTTSPSPDASKTQDPASPVDPTPETTEANESTEATESPEAPSPTESDPATESATPEPTSSSTPSTPTPSSTPTSSTSRQVSYRQLAVTVPISWPVIDLAANPTACPRVDQNAVYLGTAADPVCPSQVVGQTETVTLSSPPPGTPAGTADTIAGRAVHIIDDGQTSGKIVVIDSATDVQVGVTVGADRSVATGILATLAAPASSDAKAPKVATGTDRQRVDRTLKDAPTPQPLKNFTGSLTPEDTVSPGAVSNTSSTSEGTVRNALFTPADTTVSATPDASASPNATDDSDGATVTASAVSTSRFVGRGFDTCAQPSIGKMSVWKSSSPYGAIGVYIGGRQYGCAGSGAYTPSWVASAKGQGWKFIPTYVGSQLPGADSVTSKAITPANASSLGRSEGVDAVLQMQRFGFGAGNPIYSDIEAYAHTASNKSAAMTYLKVWSSTVRSYGYRSGVYGSMASLFTDLASTYNASAPVVDYIWLAYYDGQANTDAGTYLKSWMWSGGKRIKQYRGGHTETWGGVAINIDNDYVDGALAPMNPGDAVCTPRPKETGASTPDRLIRGQGLGIGQPLVSPSGVYTAVLQDDGNFVVYRNETTPVWSTETGGSTATIVRLNSAGMPVLLGDCATDEVWDPGIGYGNQLVLGDNGVLTLWNSTGLAIWSSDRGRRIPNVRAKGGLLTIGQALVSTSGAAILIMQTDGNLVSRVDGRAKWATATNNRGATKAYLTLDGELQIRNNAGGVLWRSNSSKLGATKLVLGNDGTVSLLRSNNTALWDSKKGLQSDRVTAGMTIKRGQTFYSQNRQIRLVLQGDGKLVLYRSNKAIWSVKNRGSRVTMQGDGNLVLYSGNRSVWSTRTRGSKPYLVLQNDRNVVLYGSGKALWQTKTRGK